MSEVEVWMCMSRHYVVIQAFNTCALYYYETILMPTYLQRTDLIIHSEMQVLYIDARLCNCLVRGVG